MSGFNPYGNPPQYPPPPQNPIYPQMYNPSSAPPPGQPATQPAQPYPYQPGFAYAYPTQAGMVPSGPGIAPTAPYPGQMATAPAPAPAFSYAGYPNVTPQQGYGTAVEWIPSTPGDAATLSDRAVVAGYEGRDGSPLWVIRSHFRGDLIPGKLAAKHRSAYVPWGGDENSVNNFETWRDLKKKAREEAGRARQARNQTGNVVEVPSLTDQTKKILNTIGKECATGIGAEQETGVGVGSVCCARPERIRWLESRNGAVPPNAVIGGHTAGGETLYIGRAKHEGSLTPGKVHPSHKAMYISYGGKEISHNTYEVLCTI